MFWHLFAYRLKCLLRNRGLIFWTLLFPLFMATLFHFAFGNLMTTGTFQPIKVAVVDNVAYRRDIGLQQMLSAISEPGDGQLLDLTITDPEQAAELLEERTVAGTILVSEQGVALEVKRSGLNQSVLKAVLDDYVQTASTVSQILQQNPNAAPELMAALQQRIHYTVEKNLSDAEPNIMLIMFYALIANTCLFGSSWGLKNSTDTQANLSDQGLRRSAAPTHKLRIILSDTLAALVITYSEVLILLGYLGLVLGVQLGNELGYILMIALLGSLTGVAWGTMFGTLFRQSEAVKGGIITVVNLTFSFFSGMMFADIKYIVDQAAPWFSYINPTALISDAFYSLYIFDSHERFFLNAGLLGVTAVVLSVVSYLGLRSERYASL